MPTVKVTLAEAQKALKGHDWSKSDATTDEEIARHAAADPDVAPDMTDRLRRRAMAVDVASLRRRLDMTQAEFARAYRFSVGAVRDMEQGRRVPSGPAAALLELIAKDPEFVRTALAKGN
jgi:putative transcriptional regulator